MKRAWAAALLALAACTPAPRTAPAPPPAAQATPADVAPAPPTPPPLAAAPSQPDKVPTAPPKAATKEAPKDLPKEPPKAATKPAPPKAPAAATPPKSPPPAKSEAPPQPARVATLDLKSLEQRLRDTGAIGVMTKLSLKNQVDDLLDKFRDYHRGALKVPLAELRRPYELLLMKVLTLLQDGDPALAQSINASREAIWSVLTDREKFAQYT